MNLSVLAMLLSGHPAAVPAMPVTSPGVVFSPYNWYLNGASYAQSCNPGAYVKLGYSGTQITVNIDVTPLVAAKVPATQYPVVRYSVDGEPERTVQLEPTTHSLVCTSRRTGSDHDLLLQYVSGYVFLDFWTPVNVLRITDFTLDRGASIVAPAGFAAKHFRNELFLGDSITNGDDDVATFKGGITNSVETQDATLGFPAFVASGLDAEYGIVAYGGASWDHTAADSHTPGLMASYSMLDSIHSRLVDAKLSPLPDDVFINLGENSPPTGDDVPKLLAALRSECSDRTNIFLLVPFSGRSRRQLSSGYKTYLSEAPTDARTYLIDLGNNPYLTPGHPTMLSVDGQHPLTALHSALAAQLIEARAELLATR